VNEDHDLDQLFPASEIPEGFPPDLVFRALAAWATIRTLSLKLRFSPCTPIVFLRALHLPVPTRLLGHIHVALLRLLFPQIQQHYHWGAALSSHHGSNMRRFPWLPHVKKRKLDGLRWTLRAGDDLEYLDLFTWPIFVDDYAHLTADRLYWSATGPPLDELNRNVDDPRENPEVWRNLDVSLVPDDWVDPTEDSTKRQNPRIPSLSVLYLNDHTAHGEESDEDDAVINDDDEEFNLADAVDEELVEETPRKRKRRRSRKSDTTTSKHTLKDPKPMSSPPVQPTATAVDPSSAMFDKVTHSTSQIDQQTFVASQSTGTKPNTSTTNSTKNESKTMQQMFSNYWKQEQLKSQLNTATTNSTSHPPAVSSDQMRNTAENRDLSLLHAPSVAFSKTSQDSAKARKKDFPSLSPEAAILREYTYSSEHAENSGVSASKESTQETTELNGHEKSTESTEHDHLNDSAHFRSDPPCVWAHFDALKELRSGLAYHQLSVEHKLSILEYLIDEVMALDIVADEMTFRFTSKEHVDHPYGVLPTEKEFEELENDDQCAVCLGEGDLLCCDGCPSSYHQTCIGMQVGETLPEGKWYCPECVLVDPAKFGPLRDAPKSSVDWFCEADLCQSEGHPLSPTEATGSPKPSMEKQYMVIHGFVLCRSSCKESRLDLQKSPAGPKPLSKSDLREFLAHVGVDRGRWPLTQIPSSDFPSPVCPAYFHDASTFDPNHIANKYQLVAPLLAPKRLNAAMLKSVEDQCSPLSTSYISEWLSKSVKSDALLIQKQNSLNPPFSDVLLASNFARDLHQKLLKSLLFRTSHYVWATESFLPLLSKASSVDAICKVIVGLVDAAHPRAFQSEWFESPSHKPATAAIEKRGKATRVSISQDSSPASEKSCRHWQCMLPGNILCDLAKNRTNFNDWIRRVKPELATLAVQKRRRKRENRFIMQTGKAKAAIDDTVLLHQSFGDRNPLVKGEETAHRSSDDKEEGYHFRHKQEAPQESTGLRDKPQIEKEQESLITSILDLPKEKWLGEFDWPIAGRRLFEPIGILPKQDIRRLARRAGSVRSPFVLYSSAYEVGQASCYHVWRKHMLICNAFEGMILGLRILATFLDTDAIRHATTTARKCGKKSAPAVDIYCCNTDISSGEHEYLVLSKNGSWGTWTSSHSIELKSLVPYQFQKVADIKLKRKSILQKRKQQSARKARPVVNTSQSQPNVAASNGPSNLSTTWQSIVERHNQEIARLLLLFRNNIGPEFFKARDFIRSETIEKLQKVVVGSRMNMQSYIVYLASLEKGFLEYEGRSNPDFLRYLHYLYPPNEAAGWQASSVSNATQMSHLAQPNGGRPGQASTCSICGEHGHKSSQCPKLSSRNNAVATHAPNLAYPAVAQLRKAGKCTVCGEYGHNRLQCPNASSLAPKTHISDAFPGHLVDSMAVVTARDSQTSMNSTKAKTSYQARHENLSDSITHRMGPSDWRGQTALNMERATGVSHGYGKTQHQLGSQVLMVGALPIRTSDRTSLS
jgi:hypothetical protein